MSNNQEKPADKLQGIEDIGEDASNISKEMRGGKESDSVEISKPDSSINQQEPADKITAPASKLPKGMSVDTSANASRFAALKKTAGIFTPSGYSAGGMFNPAVGGFGKSSASPPASKFAALKKTANIFVKPEEPADEGPGKKDEAVKEETKALGKKYKHLTPRAPGEKNAAQKRIEEYVSKEFNEKIVKVRHFKSGKLDDYGKVVGVYEFTGEKFPHVRQDHHYDENDRVLKLEKFEKDFSKPLTRLYFYEGDIDKVVESVWLDRYGKIDNIHRYAYDIETGLMMERAEYDREGKLFYLIRTKFDMEHDPVREVEEAWFDKSDQLIKKQVYDYDENGEIIVETRFDANNQFDGAFHFTYDSRGILSQKKWQSRSGRFMSTFKYTVDDNENTTKLELFNDKDELESIQTFKYDEIGNLVEEKWMDDTGEVLKHLKY